MSRIRHIQLFDANGDPVVLNNDRLPVFMDDRGFFLQDSPGLDGFGRQRVSEAVSLFDNSFEYNLSPRLYSNSTAGAGTITHSFNHGAAVLSTGGTALGDKAILQSKPYFRYQHGKSQLVQKTATLGAPKANVRQRIGYFEDNDGLFFEQTETDKKVVIRSSVSGAPVETVITQGNWNKDKFDGSGESGITIDFSKDNIFHIDFQFLGAGRVRFGFVVDGILRYCHEYKPANDLDVPYMRTANLPCRTEIENTGVAASATTLEQYCTLVASEGGVQEDFTETFSTGRPLAALAITAPTRRPVLSIRPSPSFNGHVNRGHIIFDEIEMLAATNNCFWELIVNGTLGGGTAWNPVDATYSNTDFDIASTTIAGGIKINEGYVVAGAGVAKGEAKEGTITELFNDFTGLVPDTLSLVCTPFTGTSNINALMRWQEQK